MARGRMLSKSLSTSEKRALLHTVTPLAEFAQALYPLLISHADDFGRESGDLFTVKHAVDPSSPRTTAEFGEALQALAAVELIEWYVADVDGKARNIIQINEFEAHQVGLHRRTTSKFPGNSGNFPKVPSELNRTELNRTEGKGTELKGTSTRAHARASHDPNPRTAEENVKAITKLVLSDVLPLGISKADLPEVTKSRCAALGLAYDSGSVHEAIEIALKARRA